MPQILTTEQLIGVREKLDRANQNILNLKSEINAFLNERPDSTASDDNKNAGEELFEFWAKRKIPPRFSVIAGEIVHHLRSCLDHIAWILSSDSYRISDERQIAFPIITRKTPWDNDTISRYNRNIKGITDAGALALIAKLQPHHAADPADDPIAIVHELNRIDKHHNLVLVITSFNMRMTIPVQDAIVIGGYGNMEINRAVLTEKVSFQIAPYMAFGQFGKREKQPVIESLTHLFDAIGDVVKMFAGEK
jgi:hypothetical protein